MATKTPLGVSGKGKRGISTAGWLLRGAAAGAAGSTALNAVTYLDMAVRGRGTSSTPEDTVEKLAATVHVAIPGEGENRQNRVEGLGPLMGVAAGFGGGGTGRLAPGAGYRPATAGGTNHTTPRGPV